MKKQKNFTRSNLYSGSQLLPSAWRGGDHFAALLLRNPGCEILAASVRDNNFYLRIPLLVQDA